MKNGNLFPAQLKPESNQYLIGSGQFFEKDSAPSASLPMTPSCVV